MPHPVVILFIILVLAGILTYIIPAGEYERVLVNGRLRVVPGTFTFKEGVKPGLLGLFTAIPKGYKAAAEIIFAVLAGGVMFGLIEKSKSIETGLQSLINWVGEDKRNLVIILSTLLFGFLGIAVGYENNIAMVPLAVAIAFAIEGDLILAAGMSVAAITVGFGLSPINPYTVGTGHKIAEMPMFSGAILRSLLCAGALAILCVYNLRYYKKLRSARITPFIDNDWIEESYRSNAGLPKSELKLNNQQLLVLSTFILGMGVMLFGIFNYGWYINEISGMFLIIGIIAGIIGGNSSSEIGDTVLSSIAKASPGAFMVGYAAAIKQIMLEGKISDTICNSLVSLIENLPTVWSAVFMSIAQGIINFFIPSGSGQALTTLPIMIPLGDIVGVSRQTSILAFQIGDGVTNLINPTLGGLIAMIAFCRVPFDRWIKFIFPLMVLILILAWITLLIAVKINWT